MDSSDKRTVNLQDGVFVAVKPPPGWRTRALRTSRTARERTGPIVEAPVEKKPRRWKLPAFRLSTPQGHVSSVLMQWELASMPPLRRFATEVWATARRPVQVTVLVLVAFTFGFKLASGPDSVLATIDLRNRLARSQTDLKAREGELELVRLEMARMNSVMENSRKYGIPADLAAEIYDIALAEGIDPDVAFKLVDVESDFTHKAVSPKGAVGLAQVMPSTAYEMDPKLNYEDLFERKTNLRLGFRYLRALIRQYHGNLRYALLAYNRGPGTVDNIRRQGGDPENGYARTIMGAQ